MLREYYGRLRYAEPQLQMQRCAVRRPVLCIAAYSLATRTAAVCHSCLLRREQPDLLIGELERAALRLLRLVEHLRI